MSGERSALYGGEVQATVAWAVARGDSGGSATRAPDYVLIANGNHLLLYIISIYLQ